MFKIVSKEVNVNGNICEILENHFDFLNNFEEKNAKEFDSKYDNYRDIDEKEKTDFINQKPNMLPFHKQLSKLDLNKTQMDYDATRLYPSAMWDEKSVYPEKETGFAFKPLLNDVYVEAFIM